MPSEASLCNLMGDLFVKLDNVTSASKYYRRCLQINPYKISACTNLCDIAADSNVTATKLRKEIFVDFNASKTNLSRSPHSFLPALPSIDAPGIHFLPKILPSDVVKNQSSVPAIEYNKDITVAQLRALVRYSPIIINDDDDDENIDSEYQRFGFINCKIIIYSFATISGVTWNYSKIKLSNHSPVTLNK